MTLLRGVTRSKRRAQQWLRKAAENGLADACLRLGHCMYADHPYSRAVGHVEEAAGVATSSGVVEGHNVPPEVLTNVMYWLQKGCVTGRYCWIVLATSSIAFRSLLKSNCII